MFRTVGLPERISLGVRRVPHTSVADHSPAPSQRQRGHPRPGSRQVPGHASSRHTPALLCGRVCGRWERGQSAGRTTAGKVPLKSKAKILTAILFIRSFPRSFVQLLQTGGTSFRSWLYSQSEKKIVKICACYGPQHFNLTMKEEQECRSAIEEDFLPT